MTEQYFSEGELVVLDPSSIPELRGTLTTITEIVHDRLVKDLKTGRLYREPLAYRLDISYPGVDVFDQECLRKYYPPSDFTCDDAIKLINQKERTDERQ